MSQSKLEIIDDIKNHFSGISYKQCYVGITKNVKSRLFGDHNVSKDNGHWIYRIAQNDDIAREVEQYFLNAGMDGGGGGGDNESKTIYAYKITSETCE